MKKTLPLIILLSSSVSVMAQTNSEITGMDINSSESPYTNVCMAATESWSALDAAIEENGFTPMDVKETYCNDTQLMRFARENLRRNVSIPAKVIVKKTDNSTETELCLAALKGEPLPAGKFTYSAYQTLRCNGKPLDSFVRIHGDKEIVDIL